MDFAYSYDHINYNDRAQTPTSATPATESTQLSDVDSASSTSTTDTVTEVEAQPRQNLQTEFQETFKAFSNSSWGTALGGLWGNVRKQGETYYTEAKKEVTVLSADALKELEGLRNKVVVARSRSNTVRPEIKTESKGAEEVTSEEKTRGEEGSLDENDTLIARFRSEAAKRLKEIQKAEDAADDALDRFGTNIRNFLRDAISVSAPEPANGQSTEVLFESKDALTGKRVIHSSRMDAQLHVIHTTLDSFSVDPSDAEWTAFKEQFDIEEKTGAIAKDLDRYAELRSAMENLVPEKVEYKAFWSRYYFLRHVIETQEEKRREMLRASATQDEEVGWGEDSDTEADSKDRSKAVGHRANDSTSTLQLPNVTASDDTAKTTDQQPRRSHDEKSVADSEASYDLVSGATSRAPGSPKDGKTKGDDSDDDDWE